MQKFPLLLCLITAGFILGCWPKKSEGPSNQEIAAPPRSSVTLPNGEVVKLDENEKSEPSWPLLEDPVEQQAQVCVYSLCDIPRTTVFKIEDKGFILTESEIESLPVFEEKFEQMIWPQLSALLDEDEEASKKQNRTVEKRLESLAGTEPFEVAPFVETFMKYLYSLTFIETLSSEAYDIDHYQETGVLRVKPSIMQNLPESQRINVQLSMDIYNETINGHIPLLTARMEQWGLRNFILFQFERDSFAESRSAFIEYLQDLIDTIKPEFPMFIEGLSTDTSFQKLLRGDDLMPIDELSIVETYRSILSFEKMIKSPWKQLQYINFDVSSLATKEKALQTVREIGRKNSDERYQQSKQKAYNICKQSLSAYMATRPSEVEIDRFNQRLVQIKDGAKIATKKLYPQQPDSTIESFIEGIKFAIPRTTESFIDEFLRTIEQSRMTNENQIDIENMGETDIQNISGIMIAITEFDEAAADDPFQYVYDLCLSYLPKSGDDRASTLENRLILSYKTIQNEGTGPGVAAHEIGHRVHNQFEDSERESLNQCLQNRHFYWAKVFGSEELDQRRFFDEDYADHFASKVLKELDWREPQNNLGCFLFEDSNESTGTLPFFRGPHPLAPFNSETVHSPQLFRLVQIAQDLGHNTESCESFAQSEREKLHTNSEGDFVFLPRLQRCQ